MKIRPAQGGIRSGCDRIALSLDATPPLLGVRLNEHLEHEHLEHDCGLTVFRHARRRGLEGIVSKRLGSRYRSGRSPDWLKSKNPEAPAVRREAEEDWRKERIGLT